MNTKYYLAVDIGASSGRHMLSHLENGKIVLEEIYRFPNGMIEKNGHKVWDVDQLFQEILIGMKKCAMVGKIPYSMGIDTWAVDFVLLDENEEEHGEEGHAHVDGAVHIERHVPDAAGAFEKLLVRKGRAVGVDCSHECNFSAVA